MPELFGKKLAYLRRQASPTQEELRQKLALANQGYLSNLEAARVAPSLDLIIRIALLFRVEVDYLIDDRIPIEKPISSIQPEGDGIDVHSFAGNLLLLRTKAGITQGELAHRLGSVQQAHISNLEAGRKAPSLHLLLQVADLFNSSVHELLVSSNKE